MQWIVSHIWCLVVIYLGHWSVVDSLQWDVESISEFDYEEANDPMGPNGPYFELIFLDDTVYEGWMGYQFTSMHKDVLVIRQGCTRISEWYVWTKLID